MPRITFEQQVKEVEREIAMRHTVYARRVEGGKMTEAQADKLIKTMAAVLVSLKDYLRIMEAKL